jgi:hypothetical protein
MGIDSGHPARGWFTAETAAQKARLAEGAWKMLIHLPIIILTFLHPTPIADTAPRFDIARECQSEGGSKEEQKRCADEETQARDTLQTEWIQFAANAKRQCYEETNIDGTPSYVEFLTCLEMERDVRNPPK